MLSPETLPPMSVAVPPVPAPVRTLAVTGGKGGVGKTNVSANLAIALSELGKRTLLLDADLGLANVDVLLGLSPRYTLADLVAGRCSLDEVILDGPSGVMIVPAASGRRHMAELRPAEHAGRSGRDGWLSGWSAPADNNGMDAPKARLSLRGEQARRAGREREPAPAWAVHRPAPH